MNNGINQINKVIHGDCLYVLKTLPDNSVHCCVTSPPYWGLRDYGVDGQLGLEKTPEGYVEKMVEVFREVRRVLRDDGTLWLNLGDSFGFPKQKDLTGIPWRVAFALQADGWYLRSDIIWYKPNAMPESVKDRPTKAHEYIFLLSKSPRYYYDADAIREEAKTKWSFRAGAAKPEKGDNKDRNDNGRRCIVGAGTKNKRTVWHVATRPFKGAHFAVFPPDLIEPCILAGCPEGGIVLDTFFGSGTTGVVASKLKRGFIGIELNPEYIEIAKTRLNERGNVNER